MADDRSAFLRAILEQPEDDLPRLIFADWLDEHGETPRAELIRAQVQLDHWRERGCFCVSDDRPCSGCEENARRNDLLEQVKTIVPVAFPELVQFRPTSEFCVSRNGVTFASRADRLVVRFRRGFVGVLGCSNKYWRRRGPTILEHHPIQEVELENERCFRIRRQRHSNSWEVGYWREDSPRGIFESRDALIEGITSRAVALGFGPDAHQDFDRRVDARDRLNAMRQRRQSR